MSGGMGRRGEWREEGEQVLSGTAVPSELTTEEMSAVGYIGTPNRVVSELSPTVTATCIGTGISGRFTIWVARYDDCKMALWMM